MSETMPEKSSERLLSLDVFRGMTIAGMILVNSPGNQTAYTPLEHAEWNGCTPTDLVFPFFVFIVGVSLVFSLSKRSERGEDTQKTLLKVLQRSALIFGLGLLLNGFPYYNLHTLRIPGVLQRIAVCYFFAALLFLKTTVRVQILATIGLLAGYWLAMTRIPVPGYVLGDLSKEGSVASFIDRMLLAGHTYKPVYDPEGILSSLPAIATALMGNLSGMWLRAKRSESMKLMGMITAGTASAAAGWFWGQWFPINKALWTSSYVLWTGGLALYLLAFLYWIIEMKGWRRWSQPFEVFGVNAIAAYILHILFLKIQNLIHLPHLDGTPGNLRFYISEHLFGWTSPLNASLFYALSYTLLWLAFLWFLYRRKIFIRI